MELVVRGDDEVALSHDEISSSRVGRGQVDWLPEHAPGFLAKHENP
jgi:hypothetical protein